MSDASEYIYPDEGLRSLILAQADAVLGPLESVNVGEYPGEDLLVRIGDQAYVSIEVVDGNGDRFESEPVVDIDVFALSRAKAKLVAAGIALLLVRYPESTTLSSGRVFTIDRATCLRDPVKMPWEDSGIRRQSATYQLSIRR